VAEVPGEIQMKVFADYHHMNLYYSLHKLFEQRLGWKLYRPIGMEWFIQGYWKIGNPYPDPSYTAKQYLEPNNGRPGYYQNLNAKYQLEDSDGTYRVWDEAMEYEHRALTLQQFKDMDIDIVISSVPWHDDIYEEMTKKYHPKAKFISHVGNPQQISTKKNIMCSAKPTNIPSDSHSIVYHQEFDLDTFSFIPSVGSKIISSYIHVLPQDEIAIYKALLPEYSFLSYGINNPDGIILKIRDVAKAMQRSEFIWHVKQIGEGFGHAIHNAFATGRPPIIRSSYMSGFLSQDLLIDNITCIDLDHGTDVENRDRIRRFSQPDNLARLQDGAYKRFKEVVNFDAEFVQLQRFLGELV
jgi:hypothetical protein